MKLPAEGACQCGRIRYRIVSAPLMTLVCHCQDCQKLSSSAFSVTMILSRDAFELTDGELREWRRPTDAGGVAVCWFCPDCGNRIFHENPEMPEIVRLKPGTLDDTSVLEPAVHVWTCREQPWLERYAALPKIDRQPDLKTAFAALQRGEVPF